MRSIYAKTFSAEAYTRHLVDQHALFRELERLCTAHAAEEPLCAVFDTDLHRSAALESDVRYWANEEGADGHLARPSDSAMTYLQMLEEDASDPWMLLCHHFLQYNAVLSGGQFLGRMVSERIGAAAGDTTGAHFYTFAASCQPPHSRVQQYIDTVDGLSITEELRDRMMVRMRQIYALLLAMFDEAHAIAPVEGISYKDGKTLADGTAAAAEGAVGTAGSTLIPPPLDPVDRFITLQELCAANGKTKGLPLLTSVVGRVYDVSAARDLFGPGAPYEMFVGHDGTYNLAVMSLKKGTLDTFEYELDDEEKECLSDWVAYFDNRYGRPVGLLAGCEHSVTMQDLPAATKIPFTDLDDDGGADEKPQSPAAPTSRL